MSNDPVAARMTPQSLRARKSGEKIVCLTAYTASMAQRLDPHCDILLVEDNLGVTIHGLPTTRGVTLDMMILHGCAVMRGSSRALVAIDLPFGSYEQSPEQAFETASRLLEETRAQAVRLEAFPGMIDSIAVLSARGIPVIGHVRHPRPDANPLGPHSDTITADRILADAISLDRAGAIAIMVQGASAELAAKITASVFCPTLGIGSSCACDGQILVTEDMLGICTVSEETLGLFDRTPEFHRRYAEVGNTIEEAIRGYALDVRSGAFPIGPES